MNELWNSQTTLLLAMGMSAYIGLLHLGYVRRWRDPHVWVSLWALAALLFQGGRWVQLGASDPEVAVAATRLYVAVAPFLIGSLCGFARALGGRPTGAAQALGFLAFNLGLSAAIVGTDLFVDDATYPRRDWLGRPHIGVVGGGGLLILPLYIVWAVVWIAREVRRSPDLSPLERRVLLGSQGVYALLGLLSVATSLRWIPIAGTAEYGPVALGLGLSFLLVHRRRRLEDALHSQVDARTAELAASEARYRGLIENAPIGIFACDAAGHVTTRNPRLLEILGPPGDEVAAGVAEPVRECLARGEVVTSELRTPSPRGRGVDVRLVVAPLRGAGGALGLVEDVSERLALEEGLRRSQKLESVGQLAAGIAHEINNPMAFVRTNLAVLREEWDALRKQLGAAPRDAGLLLRFAECEALIDESLEGIERTIAIARDMREFAHSGGDGRGPLDLNQLLEACVRVAAPHRQGAAHIEEHYAELPPVWGSGGQLRQVFVNLLVNALQSVGEAGTVVIETALDGERAVVRVHDDGAGILPEHRERLFDPFFTTRPAGEGTGLGLYVSHEIVRAHGGEISVASAPGEGATFEVRLPLAAGREGGD